jgi:hypothetical protein
MTLRTASLLFFLIDAAAAADAPAPRPLPTPSPPPTPYVTPTPAPQPPPTNPGPVIVPRERLSPLLTEPGPLFPGPQRAGPTYPASPVPAPIDQQKVQSYRNDLVNQRFQLDRQGVSPDNGRYREIQRQLNQPGSR